MAEEETATKTSKKSEKTKSRKGLIGGIIGGIVGVIVIAVVAIVLNLGAKDPSDPTAKISYSKAFFIYDDGYTLWNADGKRLTNDSYSDTSSFVGGYAYVRKDDQAGIIHDDGRMSVEFGRYGEIAARGGLYLAQDGNTKEYSLITGNGRELVKGSDLSVSAPSYTSGFAVVESDTTITAYNYAGNLIFEIPAADDADSPAMNSSNDFGVVYYANNNYVFDVRDGRMIASFEGPRFSFYTVSNDRKMILLENYNKESDYRLVADGKVYTLDDSMKYYSFTAQNQPIGFDTYSRIALLDSNFQIIKEVSSSIQLKDSYNYAVEEEDKVAIYKDGNKIKEFDNATIASGGLLYENYYAVNVDGRVTFYDLEGRPVFNGRDFAYGMIFNKYHLAVVADEGEAKYLIDASGNRVTDYTAESFLLLDGGFEVRNSDKKYTVADKTGKLVTDFVYEDMYYRTYAEPRNIWTGEKADDKYDVIDVDNGRVIASDINVYDFSANYFTAKNEEKKKVYYTYTGEIFYTES